jgi:hypothetical protein
MKEDFDLFNLIKNITLNKGINPLEYTQTLTQANQKRKGFCSIISSKGVPIDLVFQEFQATYPWMFESIDDFVSAIEDRLARNKILINENQVEDIPEWIVLFEILNLWQFKTSKLKKIYGHNLQKVEDKGWINRNNGYIELTQKGINYILGIKEHENQI